MQIDPVSVDGKTLCKNPVVHVTAPVVRVTASESSFDVTPKLYTTGTGKNGTFPVHAFFPNNPKYTKSKPLPFANNTVSFSGFITRFIPEVDKPGAKQYFVEIASICTHDTPSVKVEREERITPLSNHFSLFLQRCLNQPHPGQRSSKMTSVPSQISSEKSSPMNPLLPLPPRCQCSM